MVNRSVISLLKCLKPEEITYLKKFLISPFFNSKTQVLDLFNYLIRYYPDFKSESKLENSIIFKKLNPKHKLSKLGSFSASEEKEITKLLKNSFYQLRKLVEEFIIYQELSQNTVEKNHLLFNRFEMSTDEKLIQKQFENIDKDVESLKIGQEKIYQSYKLYSIKNKLSNRLSHNSEDIEKIVENLDALIILQKLKFGKELLLKKNLFNDKQSNFTLEELKSLAQENIKNKDVLIGLYSEIVLYSYSDYSLGELNNIIDRFEKYAPNINEDEALSLLIFLINYSNSKLTQGELKYLEVIFRLYEIGLDNNLLFKNNGFIFTHHYKNIVSLGCGLKKHNWIENFIVNYKSKISPSLRNNLTQLANSLLEFSRGNYEKALDHGQEIEFQDIYDKIIVKNLVLRCYYELGDYYLLEYYADAYKKFLHTNKLIGVIRKKRILNFITMVKLMSKYKSIGENPSKLHENHKKLLPMECNNWVLEKLNSSTQTT